MRWTDAKPARLARFGALLAVAVLAFCVRSVSGGEAKVSVSDKELRAAIVRSGKYLIRVCGEDGRFQYVVYPRDNREYPSKYNVLRHAGTMYALAMYYRFSKDAEALAALRRSGKYLRGFVSPLPFDPELSAVWSDRERWGGKNGERGPAAKLGGSGLGLIALSELHLLSPKDVPLEQLQAVGRFIVAMQDTRSGQFRSKVYLRTGLDLSWSSLYYPGEAMLGLVYLYRIDKNPKWLETAVHGMGFLAWERRQPGAVLPLDHWALLATAAMLPYHGKLKKPSATRDELLLHGRTLCKLFVSTQITKDAPPAVLGGFVPDARTCPAATRLEGLVASLDFLPEKEEADLRGYTRQSLELGMDFLVRNQIKEGEYVGGMPRAPLLEDVRLQSKNLRERYDEIRIDYVQHAMSAMIGLYYHRNPNKKP